MSISTVQTKFNALNKDRHLSNREARELLKEARKNGVTAGEAALIGKFAERAVTADPRVVRISQDGFFAAKGTKAMLEAFASRYAGRPEFPTGEQLKKLYIGIAEQRLEAGKGKEIAGPPVSNPNDYPWYDMTPPGLMDMTKAVYVIDNRLIYRNSGFTPNGMMSRWFDLGPAPTF